MRKCFSRIGLGTGLHTFILYLGPHIAKVTHAANLKKLELLLKFLHLLSVTRNLTQSLFRFRFHLPFLSYALIFPFRILLHFQICSSIVIHVIPSNITRMLFQILKWNSIVLSKELCVSELLFDKSYSSLFTMF